MSKVKKNATSFKKMNAMQMKKINGGDWMQVTNPDGSVTKIWV
jgi:hypothetical protein